MLKKVRYKYANGGPSQIDFRRNLGTDDDVPENYNEFEVPTKLQMSMGANPLERVIDLTHLSRNQKDMLQASIPMDFTTPNYVANTRRSQPEQTVPISEVKKAVETTIKHIAKNTPTRTELNDIAKVQEFLHTNGYLSKKGNVKSGEFDGIMGFRTKAAMNKFLADTSVADDKKQIILKEYGLSKQFQIPQHSEDSLKFYGEVSSTKTTEAQRSITPAVNFLVTQGYLNSEQLSYDTALLAFSKDKEVDTVEKERILREYKLVTSHKK